MLIEDCRSRKQQCFEVSENAVDLHQLMIAQHMIDGQLDVWCSQ